MRASAAGCGARKAPSLAITFGTFRDVRARLGWGVAAEHPMRLVTSFLLLFTVSLFPLSAFGQSQADNSRKLVNKVVPAYPDLARRMNLNGIVKVEAVVATNGTVKSTRIIGGNPVLAMAAEDAVRRWKYVPASTESTTVVELRFSPH